MQVADKTNGVSAKAKIYANANQRMNKSSNGMIYLRGAFKLSLKYPESVKPFIRVFGSLRWWDVVADVVIS